MFRLPYSITLPSGEYEINTNTWDILIILECFNDPDLENSEKIYFCLSAFYYDFENMPEEDYETAFEKALEFFDAGMEKSERHTPRTMDWKQDAPLIFPAINRIAGCEVRSLDEIHWWTFMGWFMEIREGIFSDICTLRHKKATGKKLEKGEKEYWNANKQICQLHERLTEAEKKAKEKLLKMLD